MKYLKNCITIKILHCQSSTWFIIYALKPTGYFTYNLSVWNPETLRSAHTQYLCILYVSQNKQRSFLCAALKRYFYNWGECLLRGTELRTEIGQSQFSYWKVNSHIYGDTTIHKPCVWVLSDKSWYINFVNEGRSNLCLFTQTSIH